MTGAPAQTTDAGPGASTGAAPAPSSETSVPATEIPAEPQTSGVRTEAADPAATTAAEPAPTEAPKTEAPAEEAPATETPRTADSGTESAQTEAPSEQDVTLPIELPSANGEMAVSADPENRFIRAVVEARGLDPALLAAVYSVPEGDQNFVFEFYSAGERSADRLRRVYLLTQDAAISSVAASSNAEREGISATENWFCMNVLIKGVIFPSVRDRMVPAE